MSKQVGVIKLFAVVALVGAVTGCGKAEAKPRSTPCPDPTPAAHNGAAPDVSASTPRTLPNGRPASGNVAVRITRPVDNQPPVTP